MRISYVLTMLLWCGLAAACESDPSREVTAEACVGSEGAVARIRVPGPGELELPSWGVEEIARLGGLEREPRSVDEPVFGRVVDVARDSRGRTYVADVFSKAILAFGSDGKRLRAIGGPGEGPGEFNGIMKMTVTRADTLRVFDYHLWRLSVFSPSHDLIRTESPPAGPGIGQLPEVAFDRAGRLYQLSYEGFEQSLLRSLDGRTNVAARGTNSLVLWNAESRRWEEIARVPSREVYFAGGLMDAPFRRRPLWDVRPEGGLWYSDSGEYQLHRIDLGGETSCTILVDRPPPPVTRSDRERYYAAADVENVSEAQRRRIQENRDEIPLPDRQPVLERIVVASDGRLFVRPNDGAARQDSVSEWHVWGPDGRILARILLPTRFVPRQIDGDFILGIEPGPLDESYVVTLRVRRP